MLAKVMRVFCVGLVAFAVLPLQLEAAIQIQSLTPTPASPQPVATRITWQAAATGSGGEVLEYRFEAGPAGSPNPRIVRDFHRSSSFEWVANQHEGPFVVRVTVRDALTQETVALWEGFDVTSRVAGGVPVVSPTNHPLVALYSAPACPAGLNMRVRFRRANTTRWDTTPFKLCSGQTSMNFHVAGMRANATYILRHEISDGAASSFGPPFQHTTGSIPDSLVFPTISVPTPANPETSLYERVVLLDYLAPTLPVLFPVATDLTGGVLWYYDRVASTDQSGRFMIRPVEGGTFLLLLNDPGDPIIKKTRILREFDLTGTTLRETNAARVSEQVVAMGHTPITAFHHEALRLPNGHTLVLTYSERIFPAGTQGATSDVNILGDTVVDLDQNFQVAWVWDSFDHMDINRAAVLGETCTAVVPGCPEVLLGPANDWLHANSINYAASTGDFILSIRHQDWVVKVDYDNGAGSGAVLWRLGQDGDFTIDSQDPYPWFSHQHDAGFELGGTQLMSLFDNGNTRVAQMGPGNSRGQALIIDEATHTATLVLNADLGTYSTAVGSGHRLANGNYHFDSGLINPGFFSQEVEVRPDGTINYVLQSQTLAYRTYRLVNLYTPGCKDRTPAC